jgi:hypothetical protein
MLFLGRTAFGVKITHPLWGLILAIAGLVSGFILTTFTLIRCRHSWQLLLTGMWKMGMSLSNGLVGVHVNAVNVIHNAPEVDENGSDLWVIFRALIPALAPFSLLE